MLVTRSILTTITSLPLAFSPCLAKSPMQLSSKINLSAQNTKLANDVFVRSASKVATEVVSNLPVKSGTHIKSATALSVEDLNNAINSLLPKKNLDKNPMKNKADVFIKMGEKYEVNPVTIVAIAMHESARGVSKGALNKNNIGGLMGRRGLRKYESVDTCIEAMAQILQKHVKNGRLTVNVVGNSGKYCAKYAAKNWIKDVLFYIKKIESFKTSQK